jgi:hypothetical protein
MEEKKSGQASRIYGLDFAVQCARNPAKLVEFTDWIYGQAIAHCFFHCKYVCDTVYPGKVNVHRLLIIFITLERHLRSEWNGLWWQREAAI